MKPRQPSPVDDSVPDAGPCDDYAPDDYEADDDGKLDAAPLRVPLIEIARRAWDDELWRDVDIDAKEKGAIAGP